MTKASELVALLIDRGWTLGIAESLTGGAVSSAIVAVPGASAVLHGAVVAYATPVKPTALGVDAGQLEEHGPVHPRGAEEMADGVRETVSVEGRPADVGISTTGIAGPASPDGQPVGTVHVGVATPAGVHSVAFRFGGDREEIRRQSVDAAISAALRALQE